MKKTFNFARLTLVMLTYERQDFALRLIKYWSNTVTTLIILDGSESPVKQEIIDQFGECVRYLHRPVGIHQRLKESIDLIQTEFVALVADDDFYMLSAVDACIKELDENQEMVACCGRALGFSQCDQAVYGSPQYLRLEDYIIGSDDPSLRVSEHMRNYVPSLINAICRAEPWKISWKYLLEKEFPVFAMGEIQFEMCMSYAGKSRVIPELMWLRSHNETEPVRGTDLSLDPSKTFPNWWRNPANRKEQEDFLSIMSRAFEELQPNTVCDARSVVIGGVDSYIDSYYGGSGRRINEIKVRLKDLLKSALSQRIWSYLKSVLKSVLSSRNSVATDIISAAEILSKSGVCVDFDTLEEIRERILAFHESRN